MRISDWSSDVCSSDLRGIEHAIGIAVLGGLAIVQLIGVHRHQAARRRDVAGAAVAGGLGAREADADGEGVVRVGGIGVAEEAGLQELAVAEAPLAPEAPGAAALRSGRALRALLRPKAPPRAAE